MRVLTCARLASREYRNRRARPNRKLSERIRTRLSMSERRLALFSVVNRIHVMSAALFHYLTTAPMFGLLQ
jgi:hypothetical protein